MNAAILEQLTCMYIYRQLYMHFSLSSHLRVHLSLSPLQLCCEDQFDYNVSFKNELKREAMEGPLCQPLLGVDSTGQKHWLLKVRAHEHFNTLLLFVLIKLQPL